MNVKSAAAAVAAACLCLALAACSGADPEPATPPSSSPGTPTPSQSTPPPPPSFEAASVGQCRDYSYKQTGSFSEDSEPVRCKKGHTAQTISVTTLPPTAMGELRAYWKAGTKASRVQSDGPVAKAAGACHSALNKHVGWSKSVIPMAFGVAWFGPGEQSWSQGDRALRCDVIWEAGRLTDSGDWSRRLEDLPGASVKGYVAKHDPSDWASCRRWTQDDGDRAYGTCADEPGVYVSIGMKNLGKLGAAWPGEVSVSDSARTWCWALVGSFDDGDGFEAHANIPLERGWAGGERSAACFLSWQDWNRRKSAA